MSFETVINLTPHAVNIYCSDDVYYSNEHRAFVPYEGKKPFRSFPAADKAARCVLEESDSMLIDGIESCIVTSCNIVGLPDPVPGVVYIVSNIVARFGERLGRTDLVIPHGIVKGDSGVTLGCTKLSFMRSF